MSSLQDQLLKAGLIDSKKAKQASKEKRKQQKVAKKSVESCEPQGAGSGGSGAERHDRSRPGSHGQERAEPCAGADDEALQGPVRS